MTKNDPIDPKQKSPAPETPAPVSTTLPISAAAMLSGPNMKPQGND